MKLTVFGTDFYVSHARTHTHTTPTRARVIAYAAHARTHTTHTTHVNAYAAHARTRTHTHVSLRMLHMHARTRTHTHAHTRVIAYAALYAALYSFGFIKSIAVIQDKFTPIIIITVTFTTRHKPW